MKRRRPLYALVVLAVVWAGLEVALALTGDAVGPVYNLRKGIRWTMEPNLRHHALRMVEDDRPFKVSTNADGLRTSEPPGPGGGKSTVLLLGDSTIFGWGVDDGQDVATALQSALRVTGTSVRVINGGQPGFSSLQSFLLLREVGLRYTPDLVVMEFSLHDFRAAPQPDSRAIDASGSLVADYWLASHSRVYRALRKLVVLAQSPPAEEVRGGEIVDVGEADPAAVRVRVPPDDFRGTLEAAAALAQANHFQFALTFPPRDAALVPAAYKDVAASVAGVTVVDYTQAWRDAGGEDPSTWLADDPGHYSPEGAARTGKALAARLAEAGLVPR